MRAFLLLLALAACGPDRQPAKISDPDPPEALADAPTDTDTARWTAGVVDLAGDAERPVPLRSVRAGAHPDATPPFDRVVFEFEGDRLPGVRVAYVDRPVRACGSGAVVPVAGDNQLEVRLVPAVGHTEAGEPTVPDALALAASPNLTGARRTCDFEGAVTWVLGIDRPNRFRVRALRQPARVVVDVRR